MTKPKTKKKVNRSSVDRIRIYMPPGWKEDIGARADELGINRSQYISRLIAIDLRNEKLFISKESAT